jgi:hypothetical protein
VFFLPSGVCEVTAIKEKVMILMDNCVLKIVECGRYGGEVVLLKVVL